jgi:hypothetical protein
MQVFSTASPSFQVNHKNVLEMLEMQRGLVVSGAKFAGKVA